MSVRHTSEADDGHLSVALDEALGTSSADPVPPAFLAAVRRRRMKRRVIGFSVPATCLAALLLLADVLSPAGTGTRTVAPPDSGVLALNGRARTAPASAGGRVAAHVPRVGDRLGSPALGDLLAAQ